MKAQPTIYQIALEEPGRELAAQLRVTIAKVAVQDAAWCRSYETLIEMLGEKDLKHPEMFVVEKGTRYNGPVLVKGVDTGIEEVGGTLLKQAACLGAVGGGADEVDTVAAVVAAECWMAALDCEDLAFAAAKGPDAIASAAAILARVCGEGVVPMPLDPDWPTFKFPMEKLLEAARRCRAWSDRVLGEAAWNEIVARVVTDIGWFAGGGTKTHEASLLLGVRMSDITA
jgi:hypothetical protein